MVGLSLEVGTKVTVIAFELIFYFLLLVGKPIHAHSLDVLLEVDFSGTFHERLVQS